MTLYKQFFADIYRYIFFHSGQDKYLAEDLTSEIFLKAYKASKKDNTKELSKAWIYRIAKNHLIDHYRKTSGKETVDIEQVVIPDIHTPLETAKEEEKKSIVSKLLDLLPKPKREILIFKYINGFSGQEIAEEIGTTPGATRVRIHEALKSLRKLVTKHSIESPL